MRCFGAQLSTAEIVYLPQCSTFCWFRQLAQIPSHKSGLNHGFLSILNWTTIYWRDHYYSKKLVSKWFMICYIYIFVFYGNIHLYIICYRYWHLNIRVSKTIKNVVETASSIEKQNSNARDSQYKSMEVNILRIPNVE